MKRKLLLLALLALSLSAVQAQTQLKWNDFGGARCGNEYCAGSSVYLLFLSSEDVFSVCFL